LKSEIFIKTDFRQERKISIKNGLIDPENYKTIDEFLRDVKVADVGSYGKQVIADAFKMKHVLKECHEPFDKVMKAIQEWFKNYLKVLDGKIDGAVEVAMKERHKVKCNITKSLYNFTDLEVDPKLLEQIENGVKNVPTIKKDGISVIEHSLREILSNLEVYMRYQQPARCQKMVARSHW
jgi:hypothetical protein